MVPSEYSTYFTTMATVGAALFGLIFVAISIAPESVAADSAPLDRQAKAVMAYFALLNPLVIALFALVPRQQIGVVVLAVGIASFVSTLGTALAVAQKSRRWQDKIRSSGFMLTGFFFYALQVYDGLRILQNATDPGAFNLLANLLVGIIILGIARAWSLAGVRNLSVRDWYTSFGAAQKENTPEKSLDKPASASQKAAASPVKKGRG